VNQKRSDKIRIISKFKDFYDSVQATGQDRTVVYIRKIEEVKGYPFPILHSYANNVIGFIRGSKAYTYSNNPEVRIDIQCHAVGFCGKVYPLLKISKLKTTRRIKKKVFAEWDYPYTICFSLNDVDEYVKNNFAKSLFEAYKDNKFKHNSIWENWFRRKNFEEHFEKMEQIKDKHENLFRKHNAPVFVASVKDHKVYYNASLKDVEFYRVFDPFTAFQEIAMYYGSLAVPLKNIPKIDDLTMLQAKGFDPKSSFRKEPSKKRK
jgi:hypothetical protein